MRCAAEGTVSMKGQVMGCRILGVRSLVSPSTRVFSGKNHWNRVSRFGVPGFM